MSSKKFWLLVMLGAQLTFLPTYLSIAQEQTPPPAQEADSHVGHNHAEGQEMQHWLTEESNVRHNKNCRFYEKSKGRPCKADEGTACKACGG